MSIVIIKKSYKNLMSCAIFPTYIPSECFCKQRSFTRWTLRLGCRQSLPCLSVLRCRCEPAGWRSPPTVAARGLPVPGLPVHYRQVSS